MQLGRERAFWCCLTLSQKTQDNLRVLKSRRLVADRVSELPLEFISLYPPPSPPFMTIFSHMTCSKCNRLEFSLGDGLFRAILSTDCKILASEFPLLLISHTDKGKSRTNKPSPLFFNAHCFAEPSRCLAKNSAQCGRQPGWGRGRLISGEEPNIPVCKPEPLLVEPAGKSWAQRDAFSSSEP